MGNSNSSINEKPTTENKKKCEGDSCKLEDKSVKSSQVAPTDGASGEPKKLKPCCACPETKKARDTWYN